MLRAVCIALPFFVLMAFTCSHDSQYYSGSAIDFLVNYGELYGLFDIYFNRSSTWPADEGNDFLKKYRVFNHTEHYLRDTISSAYEYHNFYNWSLYGPSCSSDKERRLNNMFRFGKGANDRFTDIFIYHDPWEWKEKKRTGNQFVHFTGIKPGFRLDEENFDPDFTAPADTKIFGATCNFYYPKVGKSSVMIVARGTLGCEIPFSIAEAISEDSLDGDNPVILRFDVVKMGVALISKIEIKRIHELDRRYWDYSAQTMTNDLSSNLLVEWLVHNILLGIQHFYIFDNSDYSLYESNDYLRTSPIRPFLDANIITLVRYPFSPVKNIHWNSIQEHSFATALQKFGIYTSWLGFYDPDEFFIPNEALWPHDRLSVEEYWRTIPDAIERFWKRKGHSRKVPAIVFNTQEMGCSKKHTYSDQVDQSVLPFAHASLSKYCHIAGWKFSQHPSAVHDIENFHRGHGKMFIRPKVLLEPMIQEIGQPHQIDDDHTIFPPKDVNKPMPLFFHFDSFRHSPGVGKDVKVEYLPARFVDRVVDATLNWIRQSKSKSKS